MDTIIKLPELRTGSVSFNPAVRGVHDGVNVDYFGETNTFFQKNLPTLANAMNKKLEDNLKSSIMRGRLDAQADQIQSELPAWERYGYRIGAAYQKGLQYQQVRLAEHAQSYKDAKFAGASEEDLKRIHMQTIQDINTQLTNDDALTDEYKDTLRESALNNLNIMMQAEATSNKQYNEMQYGNNIANTAVGTRNSLVAAASAGNTSGALNAIRDMFNQNIALEYQQGNYKNARVDVSKRMSTLLGTIGAGFDAQNPADVQAYQFLANLPVNELQDIISPADMADVQVAVSKMRDDVRNENGVKSQIALQDIEFRIRSGTEFTVPDAQALVNQALAEAEAGTISTANARQIIDRVSSLMDLSAAQQQKISNDPLALVGVTYTQALASGQGTQWINAQEQNSLQAFGGNRAQAGTQMLNLAYQNTSPDLWERGGKLLASEIGMAFSYSSPESFDQASNNVTASEAFNSFKSMYALSANNPAFQEALLGTLGTKDAAFISNVLRQNPNIQLRDLIGRKKQWDDTSGSARQDNIVQVSKSMDASQFKSPFRAGHMLGGWRSPAEEAVGSRAMAYAKNILSSEAPAIALNGVNVGTKEDAMTVLRSRGNVGATDYSTYSISTKLSERLRSIGGTKSNTEVGAVLTRLQRKYGEGDPERVFIDGSHNAGGLRLELLERDGSHRRTVYVPESEFSEEYAKYLTGIRTPSYGGTTSAFSGAANVVDTRDAKRRLADMDKRAAEARAYVQRESKRTKRQATPAPVLNIQRGKAPIRNSPLAQSAPSAQSTSSTSSSPRSSGKLSRKDILRQEIENESAVLDKLQAELKRGVSNTRAAEIKTEADDRRINIQAISRELSR